MTRLNGWQRLWVVMSALYVVVVLGVVYIHWPTADRTRHRDEFIMWMPDEPRTHVVASYDSEWRARDDRSGQASLVVMLPLVSASTAEAAEVRWLLWRHEAITPLDAKPSKDAWGPVKEIHWVNFGTGSNRKDCEALLAKAPVPSLDVYYVCFPETIDPRGPKAK